MKKLIIAILLCLCVACTDKPVSNNTKYIQESLLVECTSDTPLPMGYTGEDMYKALNEWQAVYNECRASKNALIKAVRK